MNFCHRKKIHFIILKRKYIQQTRHLPPKTINSETCNYNRANQQLQENSIPTLLTQNCSYK